MAHSSSRAARAARHKKTRFVDSQAAVALNVTAAAVPSAAKAPVPLLPLGALMLAVSVSGWAQNAAPANTGAATSSSQSEGKTLAPVTVKEKAIAAEGKDTLRATETTIGKGKQQLRDIPQSITVVTEKLINDRNLDTVKDALKSTAGITFLAAEGGEEDIRLRGFALQSTGDLFIDGIRDPAFYDRDTFNLDRLEVLRGSASMLFGRGSTGGAVNQVSKLPRLINEHEVSTTIGSHGYKRITGDFNLKTGEEAALRINAMATKADNNGAGSSLDKKGLALSYRLGIGTADEFLASLYYLDNNNGMNYGMPWIRPNATATSAENTLLPIDPKSYYGMASDYNNGKATMATLGHTHRFDGDTELKTQLRVGKFERDQRAGTVRLTAGSTLANFGPNTVLTRGAQLKIQNMDMVNLQSDFSKKFTAWGLKHELLTGVDFSSEKKTVFGARNAAQGGVVPVKPSTTVGRPDDGASINEASRVLRTANDYTSNSVGVYAQDLVQIAPDWKILLGLRYDQMKGDYNCYAIPDPSATPASQQCETPNSSIKAPLTRPYSQKIGEWSKRVGVLYQPNPLQSFHASYGTSFNTSGDTYSYNSQSANTDPEQSENIEFGAKLDSADKNYSTRLALFHATKKNERNTDPDTAATRLLLSGKRHTAGIEVDVSGRLTSKWEVYVSYMWMPVAKVDIAASTATTVGNRVGDRPGLSPKHSGTVWTTYQLTPKWRVGGGLNYRSAQAPADVTAPAWEAPGFTTADLMAEYAFSDRIVVKANLTNVTNKLYADSLYRGHYIPGAGRILQVTANVKF